MVIMKSMVLIKEKKKSKEVHLEMLTYLRDVSGSRSGLNMP